MRRIIPISLLTGVFMCLSIGVAIASPHQGDRNKIITATNCIECHEKSDKHTSGPHGGYATSTDKCGTCHDVHADATNPQLLMGETLTDACNYCHDLTATSAGPYNMTPDASGEAYVPAAAHRVVGISMDSYTDTEGHDNAYLLDGTVTIPGGNETDGSEGILDTSTQGQLSGQVFTCSSCHTPHGVNTVKPYLGESQEKVESLGLPSGVDYKIAVTNRLLKSKPNNITSEVSEYGSAWCAACHKGRNNTLSDKHNHPVDENAPAYRFLEEAKAKGWVNDNKTIDEIVADGWVMVGSAGEVSKDPRSNQQYAMNPKDELLGIERSSIDGYEPIASYQGKGPSCQQCHASAREVEGKFSANSNPLRGNFPHISSNAGLLVEVKDDFCTNCHAPSVLP